VWDISSEGKSQEELAKAGLDALEGFCKECGVVTSLKELGATEEMLPKIAESSIILEGGYKKLTSDEILKILKRCF
jgi:alcohol dehydrogenase class IV